MRKRNMQSEELYFSPYPFPLSSTLVTYNQPKGGDYNTLILGMLKSSINFLCDGPIKDAHHNFMGYTILLVFHFTRHIHIFHSPFLNRLTTFSSRNFG